MGGTAYDVQGSFTMCARVRVDGPNAQQGGRILTKRRGTDGWEFVAPRRNGLVTFYGGGTHVNVGTTRIDDGQWHHVAVAYDGNSKMTAFVDGRLDGAANIRVPPARSVDLWLGARLGSDDEFIGDFEAVQVYDCGLSTEQIVCLAGE